MKFKVGDRVEVTRIDKVDNGTSLKLGQVGTVVKLNPHSDGSDFDWVHVKLDNIHGEYMVLYTNQIRITDSKKLAIITASKELKIIYDSFIDVGFSEFQAFDLLQKVMDTKK